MAKNKNKKKKTNPMLSPKEQTLIQIARQVTKCTLNDTEPVVPYPKALTDEANDIMQNMHAQMTRDFYRLSVEQHIHGEPKDEVLKGNIIELPDNDAIYDIVEQNLAEKAQAWSNKMHMLHTIPCFQTGVLKKHKPNNTETEYVQWTVNKVDLPNLYLDITLQIYTDIRSKDTFVWAPGPKITTGLDFKDTDGLNTKIDVDNSVSMLEATTCVPNSLLKWTPFQMELWKNTSLYIVKQQEQNWEKSHDLDLYNYTIRDFIVHMCLVNSLLEQDKPRTTRPAAKRTKTTETSFEFNPEKQDERKVRTISTVKITSKSIPRLPTEKSVVKYNVASWNTRGHIRHYKSGKTIYVKPSVHHRKALRNNATPAPTTIKFTGDENDA